jgi:hypothetical protein
MEINPNRNVDPALPAGAPFKARPSAPAENAASFEQSAELNASLEATPDSRTEVVERAQSLISSGNYPPREVIDRIANLLAANLINEA